MNYKKDNVLVIGDTHLPFEKKGYLEFCKEIQNRCKCGVVVHIGDLVDNHSISYHEHDPDGWSPLGEMEATDEHLKAWFKAFPKLLLCRGNHDSLVDRKSKTVGLPRRCFKPFRKIWKLPKGWVDDFEFVINGVMYRHSFGNGKHAHMNGATAVGQSLVIGHSHSELAAGYLATSKDRKFGMNVGCGIDRKKYAFAYGKDFKFKPILGCGVVTDKGKYAQVFPMDLE